jgi:cytochrome c oxidase subunit 3
MVFLAIRRRINAENYMPAEITGLYCHLVDIVWVFLFPLLKLAGHR